MAWSEWKKFGSCVINTTPAFEILSQNTNTEITAISDGFLFAWSNRGYSGRSMIVKINGIEVINYNKVENTNPLRQVVLIKKGNLLTFSITVKSSDEFIGLYYFE